MTPQLRPRRTFPKNCFRLEWFDVLLEKPFSIPLNQPTITIGLNGKNTWNIPIEALRVNLLKASMPSWDSPLVTLEYDVQTHVWSSKRHQPKCSWDDGRSVLTSGIITPPPVITIDYPAVPLEIGATLEIHLFEEGNPRRDYGSITVVLVGTRPCPAMANSSDGLHQLFTDRLASLPGVPLAIIAGYLEPNDCIKNLCAISRAIPQKLREVGVSWPALCMLPFPEGISSRVKPLGTPLDCLRAAKLANVHDLTYLWLGEEPGWKEPRVDVLLPRVRDFVLGTKLEELHLTSMWFSWSILDSAGELAPLPQLTLKRLTIYRTGDAVSCEQIACEDFWREFAVYAYGLTLPSRDTEVSLCCTTTVAIDCDQVDQDRREMMDDESDEDGGDDEEELENPEPWRYGNPIVLTPMPNVKALSWVFCKCHAWIPFKAFPNLRRMHLDLLDFCGSDFFGHRDSYDQAMTELERVSLLELKEVSFRAGLRCMSYLLEATARTAPNVECLKWECDPKDSYPWHESVHIVRTLDWSVAVIRNFPCLRRLQITFRPCVTRCVDELMDLVCLRVSTEVSHVVFENVKCPDPADREIQEAAGRLIANNKQVALEAVGDGSAGVGRITYPLMSAPVEGWHGAQLYNLIVRNA